MALVAYDNSDSSEYEDDDNEATPVVILDQKSEPSTSTIIITEPTSTQSGTNGFEEETVKGQTLFNLLPQPSTKKPAVVEDDDEFLHKKESVKDIVKPKAKITVPSLSDFKDVEDKPLVKPRTQYGKKSGLLSMLPQPRNAGITKSSTSLVPHVLTKKPPTVAKKKEPLPSPMKQAKTDKSLINSYSDESDNEEGESNDFFSINKPVELPEDNAQLDIDLPIPVKPSVEKEPRNLQSYFKKDSAHVELQADYSETDTSVPYEAKEGISQYSREDSSRYSNGGVPVETSSVNEVAIDEEAIRQLCGARGKRKREDIQIVDVNQQEVLADAREWLLKGLMDDSSKRMSSSKKTGHEPTSQQRRKHQITYLAHQAKANESELQNQWANNRMTKRKTQSKYGF